MARVIGKLMAPGGKYTKDGVEKTRWIPCGVVMETDRGLRVKLECIPVGGADGAIWFSVFEEEQTTRGANPTNPAPKEGFRERGNAPLPMHDDQTAIPF